MFRMLTTVAFALPACSKPKKTEEPTRASKTAPRGPMDG
jgi:hypothetical protein